MGGKSEINEGKNASSALKLKDNFLAVSLYGLNDSTSSAKTVCPKKIEENPDVAQLPHSSPCLISGANSRT